MKAGRERRMDYVVRRAFERHLQEAVLEELHRLRQGRVGAAVRLGQALERVGDQRGNLEVPPAGLDDAQDALRLAAERVRVGGAARDQPGGEATGEVVELLRDAQRAPGHARGQFAVGGARQVSIC